MYVCDAGAVNVRDEVKMSYIEVYVQKCECTDKSTIIELKWKKIVIITAEVFFCSCRFALRMTIKKKLYLS